MIFPCSIDWVVQLEEAEGPFPWSRSTASIPALSMKRSSTSICDKGVGDQPITWTPELSSELRELISECRATGTIVFCHPKKSLAAGSVLHHVLRTMESLFLKQEPLIFKVGWTHNPVWRWENNLYGYRMCRDKWQGMLVLYVSNEPYSPAMLEAALIERYSSILSVLT